MASSKSISKVALYARVSTDDQHTLPMQINALKKYAQHRQWKVVHQVQEIASGAIDRPKREQLLKVARQREIDAIIVWRLDRWGRSVADLVGTLRELSELNIGFISFTEALDLTTATGRAMAGLLAVFAEFERDLLRERVKAGIAHARKLGKSHGRPPSAAKQKEQVKKLFAKGLSKAEIARQLNIGRTSVRRLLIKNKKTMEDKIHHRCPRCGRRLVKRIGAAGFFWNCSYYPRCKKTLSERNGKPFFRHPFDNRCPRCQQGYLIRQKRNRKYCWVCDESVFCGAAFAGSRKPN